MTVASFPEDTVRQPEEVTLELMDSVASLTAFGGASFEAIRQGARFAQTMTWRLLEPDDGNEIFGFFWSQRGPAGRFYIPLYDYKRRGGISPGASLTVNGASQLGNTLVVNGLAGSDPVFQFGDMITVPDALGFDRHLHMVAGDVDIADGAIPIEPEMYESPANGGTIKYRSLAMGEAFPRVRAVWQRRGGILRRRTQSPGYHDMTVTVITAPAGTGI